MRNYVPPPSLPTYSVLLEGESMSPSMGLLRDDLLNVCMRHVEKICKADLGRNFIERNHMENGKMSQIFPFPPSLLPWSAGSGEMRVMRMMGTPDEEESQQRPGGKVGVTTPAAGINSGIWELLEYEFWNIRVILPLLCGDGISRIARELKCLL